MTTIEIEAARVPLKPGGTGMATNGPPALWYRIDGGDWELVDRNYRSMYKLKQDIIALIGAN
jgi:hypothetical protein